LTATITVLIDINKAPMTTHRFRFDDVERAFHLMQTKEDGIIKPLIRFD
jgi:threonine dehydrogenase-like Zn-dependent dehydrogenase